MKPTSFFDLPWALQEILLSDMDTLDYDSYESSHAECVKGISHGDISSNNLHLIENFYKNVDVEHLQLRATQAKESSLRSIEELNKIIG